MKKYIEELKKSRDRYLDLSKKCSKDERTFEAIYIECKEGKEYWKEQASKIDETINTYNKNEIQRKQNN